MTSPLNLSFIQYIVDPHKIRQSAGLTHAGFNTQVVFVRLVSFQNAALVLQGNGTYSKVVRLNSALTK